ncbi:MAG: site-2 protease family protein [Verrucomicrobiales bacterium]|nr:site-2 protease family protein [Verrucomicrobiales bacterium]
MTPPFSEPQKRNLFGPSLQLGTVSGIPIRIHWSFSLLLLWALFLHSSATGSFAGTMLGMLFVLMVFGCVILHELGHSLTAQRFGIQTRSITLSPLGGLAALEKSPKDWKEELWITAAGPAVNAVIAGLLLPFVLLTASAETFAAVPFSSFSNFLAMLFFANVMLVLFNLLPAFPMDGGRLLRAFLTPSLGRLRSTRVASRIGQVIAVLLGLTGLYFSPFLAFIGVFVFLAAAAERRSVELEERLSGTTVSDAMRRSFESVGEMDTINDALRCSLYCGQSSIPVLRDERLLGIVDFDTLVRARAEGYGEAAVGSLVSTMAPLTVTPQQSLLSALREMQQRNREIVPVIWDNRLIGLLPQRSIHSVLAMQAA